MRTLLAVLLLISAGSAAAHEVRPAYLTLSQTGPGEFAATFKQPQVQGRYLGLSVASNCADATPPIVSFDNSALEQKWHVRCDGGELLRIDIHGLERTMIDALVRIDYADGRSVDHLVAPDQPWFEVKEQTPAVPVYLVVGIRHLLLGYDHLLFVMVLMFVARGWRNLLKAVTSFTVAHSLTLGLSAFNVISVSQAPVEASIALSIVVLAVEAFRPGSGNPWPVAFLFGLLHGLGFAGALKEIGLPHDAAMWALLFFNGGLEIGQLGVIALAILVLWPLERFRLALPQWVATAPLYVAGSVASFWLIQRTAQIVLAG